MHNQAKRQQVDIMATFFGKENWETDEAIRQELAYQFGPDWKKVITHKVKQAHKDRQRRLKIDTTSRQSYHLTPTQRHAICEAYKNLEKVQDLAEQYHVTKTAIYKILKRAGIDTSPQVLPVSCSTCGTTLMRSRSRIRKQKNHFCDHSCYGAFVSAGNSVLPPSEARIGQRRAREVVAQFFNLQPGNVVHHEDHNQLNNNPWNLLVFATQGDHARYHRGFEVVPLWDGSAIY